jgi:acetyltransferase EpsM
MNKPLLIIGGSGHGSVIAACIEDNRHRFNDYEWEVAGFINDFENDNIDGYPILGGTKDIAKLTEKGFYFAWGIHLIQRNPFTENFFNQLAIPVDRLATIIHKSAFIAASAEISPGVLIMNNTYVSPRVKLGIGTMVKSNALIGHDVKCGPLCHFAMGSITGAYTQLGICSDIAIGCVVLENITIGNYSFAGAASLVSRDIPDYEIHVGSPAKFLKKVRLD